MTSSEKTKALLSFLRDTATLRRKRISAHGESDRLLWFADLPKDACRSAFIADNPADIPDLWLEVRKKRKATVPPLPEALRDWVPQRFQNSPDEYVGKEPDELIDLLHSQITVIVEKHVLDADVALERDHTRAERVPEVRHLKDNRQVEDAWLEYLETQWKPWAQEMRMWIRVQDLYEQVDFMRRRLEEAEERYELLLGVGLLQWRDSTGTVVKRHLLVAPAEITLDSARGVLTVGPAASFDKFRIELDMLELQDRPNLEGTDLEKRLEELDVCAWDRARVVEILHIIANRTSPNAQVHEDAWHPLERTDETFRVLYAPALILRERRPTVYEELIGRFLAESEGQTSFPVTAPWERFVSEGDSSSPQSNVDGELGSIDFDSNTRLYFPLPTNDEQRQIAERLRQRPYVLVKGPPGTGKSHTIANLICHLLAIGQRVLVTAYAPKALMVLRDLLPSEIRSLCVTALGSSREDIRLLEESVRGILSRKNEWKGQKWADQEIDRLEKELYELEGDVARVERELRECREAETYTHTLPGGYVGTAAQIARQVDKEKVIYGWFPQLIDDKKQCPLQLSDVSFLAEFHAYLTEERLSELCRDIGDLPLPNPAEFEAAIKELRQAETKAEVCVKQVDKLQLGRLQQFPEAMLEECRAFLKQLEELATCASRALKDLTNEILADLLVGQMARWESLEAEAQNLVGKIREARELVGTARVNINSDVENAKLLVDTRQRLEHLRKGGWRGWGILAPRIIRETNYIEQCCRVNGEVPREQQLLAILLGFLEMKEYLEQFCTLLPATLASNIRSSDPKLAASEALTFVEQVAALLEFFRDCDQNVLDVIPVEKRETLVNSTERATWLRLVEAALTFHQVHRACQPFEKWGQAIRSLISENVHPCLEELAQAIEERDPARWRIAWEKRENLKVEKAKLRRYQELLNKIRAICPEVADLIQRTEGNYEWSDRLRHLQAAWNWALARAWLTRISNPELYEQLVEERQRLQENIEKKMKELVALKAWHAFFQRMDDEIEQNLVAWTKAVTRIGKGTGRYAYKHRRTARQYLMRLIPKIPAWIVPLHKVWETIDPTPGVFDTVIIDEASQAGIDSLVLLLLGKRIVVVGDDKQNSPEAVGVREEDIERLAHDHLKNFAFREEFRPDTSLYDHAERAFGTPVSLREHFRCVPEIIRFSNELCYQDAPLIPLRQPPPKRLRPLVAKFVENGLCDGEGARIINRHEAKTIVECIKACLDNKEYVGKTMGVIVLQGHAQAELIERMLAEVLEPQIREERKLRCGVPATFQGDERDVIFLSLVVAPNYQFRALTETEAQRRFNVAMSRARDQVWLFHSVQLHDLSPHDLRYRLLRFFYSPGGTASEELYEELERLECETRRRPRQPGTQPDPYESWFEVDVALELLRRKYRIRPQVEVAGYRIDLVVEGLVNRLAIECDGEVWHGPERFEQDMARQRQLERAGWTFVRIRESEFYANREGAIRRIIEICREFGIQPIGEEDREVDEDQEAIATAAEVLLEERKEENDEEKDRDKTQDDQGHIHLVNYYKELNFPDPRVAPVINVRAALRRIIENEGPLTKRFLLKIYVAGCPGLHRAGKAVKAILNRALYSMQKAGEIVIEDELGDRSPESQVLRLVGTPRVRERPAGQRDLLEIPPSELMLVLDRLLGSSNNRLQDDEAIFRALLEHYGFSRLTETRRRHLMKVLDVCLRHRTSMEVSRD